MKPSPILVNQQINSCDRALLSLKPPQSFIAILMELTIEKKMLFGPVLHDPSTPLNSLTEVIYGS